MPTRQTFALVLVAGVVLLHGRTVSQGASGFLDAQIASVAALPGEPRVVSAGGVTRAETPLQTLENPAPFDPAVPARRLAIVGGLDGNEESVRLVLDAVRWFKTSAPARVRANWIVSALPLADPEAHARTQRYVFPPQKGFFDDPSQPESRYVWRWVSYQTPDLVVEVRAGAAVDVQPGFVTPGSLAAALADGSNNPGLGPVATVIASAPASEGAALMRAVLARAPTRRSPLRDVIGRRVAREPLALAGVLARRYPENPDINYIQAVSWASAIRLASMTGDESLHAKVLQQLRPWLSGEKPLFGERARLNAIAGTLIFVELAKARDANAESAARLAAEGFGRTVAEKAPGIPLNGFNWSDDLFMGTVVPARVGSSQGLDFAARLLIEYARLLQRPDGLFNHAAETPAAWGRGNGFAALGLIETLSALPESHPARAQVLDIYRRLMAAMKTHQAPDGMWRQVVDVAGAYREESVTAQTVTAVARGIRLGWLDASFRPVVERGWRALLAHVGEDGTIVDVCFNTTAGPTRRYYLDRPAVNGADDRGGGMALMAALEVQELRQARP